MNEKREEWSEKRERKSKKQQTTTTHTEFPSAWL